MTKRHFVVVVVDDDPLINIVMSDLLADEGYQVLSCMSGSDALKVIARVQPDLVITDMQMEIRDAGLQLIEQLRADPLLTDVAVIVCSADYEVLTQRANDLAKYGAHVIHKPFELDHLLRTIQLHVPLSPT